VPGPTVDGADGGADEKSKGSEAVDTTDGGGCRTRTTRRGSIGAGAGTTQGEFSPEPERARRRLCGSSSDSAGVAAREEETERCVGVPWRDGAAEAGTEEATEKTGTGEGTREGTCEGTCEGTGEAAEKRDGTGEGAAETRAERGGSGSSARVSVVAVLEVVVVVVVG
jgi:hypothetical protein